MVLDIVSLALSATVAGDTILYKALVASSSMNLVLSMIILGDYMRNTVGLVKSKATDLTKS